VQTDPQANDLRGIIALRGASFSHDALIRKANAASALPAYVRSLRLAIRNNLQQRVPNVHGRTPKT
jgi:hypothetical protein